MKIHIFYNGNEAVFPKNNDWEKFEEHDSVRLFLACAESWRRQGWDVVRFATNQNDFTKQKFHGRIPEQYKWYPSGFWQFCAKARSMVDDPNERFYFTTFDVFNFGVPPGRLKYQVWSGGHENSPCVSFQQEHFSMSFISCTGQWIIDAVDILEDYDCGDLPEINTTYVSDERILREYANYSILPLQQFAIGETTLPLVHYARSTLARAYEAIPSV